MTGAELLAWLAGMAPALRDAAVETYLGISQPVSEAAPADHLLGYQASGVAAIVQTLVGVPVTEDDVVVDLGAGLGKVLLLARLLTGAAAHGVEIQGDLVQRARGAAGTLRLDVDFVEADAREADLHEGTVFYLYLPCTGPALAGVLERLRGVAERKPIVVCALGVDLDRQAPWLKPRPSDTFWLTIYDGGNAPRSAPLPQVRSRLHGPLVEAIATERELASPLRERGAGRITR
jgi:SAM-dependent methyltransferase